MSRRGGQGGPDGVAVVDKDAGWTSHDVVAKARGILGTRKVGHSGTLDPDATGVLVLGVGRGTRLLRFLQLLPKSYEAEITFGTETSTLDAAGEVVATHDMTGLDPDAVRRGAAALTGDIEQVPPMVSALKVGGRRLHELAREGIEVEREARPVHVSRFDVEPTSDPLVWRAVVDCSSGTYVRSLAADLGHALGGGATCPGSVVRPSGPSPSPTRDRSSRSPSFRSSTRPAGSPRSGSARSSAPRWPWGASSTPSGWAPSATVPGSSSTRRVSSWRSTRRTARPDG